MRKVEHADAERKRSQLNREGADGRLSSAIDARPRLNVVCPECGLPPEPIASLERAVGLGLFGPEDLPHSLTEAVAVSIAPEPDGARS